MWHSDNQTWWQRKTSLPVSDVNPQIKHTEQAAKAQQEWINILENTLHCKLNCTCILIDSSSWPRKELTHWWCHLWQLLLLQFKVLMCGNQHQIWSVGSFFVEKRFFQTNTNLHQHISLLRYRQSSTVWKWTFKRLLCLMLFFIYKKSYW